MKVQDGKIKIATKVVKVTKSAKVVMPTKVTKAVAGAKSSPKLVAKSKAKSLEKLKPAAKLSAKPVAPKASDAQKLAAQPVVSETKKPVVKTKAKTKEPVKATIVETTKSAAVPVKAKPLPSPVPAKPGAGVPMPNVGAPVPARAGRPSSRLAQLTVPSMAQSVASTAAKASFSQTMTSPLIVPPLASTVKKDPKLANNWKSKSVDQLTDAELIAMPDDEYMNDVQMEFFRRRLARLKQDILSNAGETTEHLREDTVVVPDPADRATIEEEHALELRTRDRERKLLKKIEQSIARIEAGDYGYCDETGEPIGVGRLLARPTASLSLEAQQRRELKQKMFGD